MRQPAAIVTEPGNFSLHLLSHHQPCTACRTATLLSHAKLPLKNPARTLSIGPPQEYPNSRRAAQCHSRQVSEQGGPSPARLQRLLIGIGPQFSCPMEPSAPAAPAQSVRASVGPISLQSNLSSTHVPKRSLDVTRLAGSVESSDSW